MKPACRKANSKSLRICRSNRLVSSRLDLSRENVPLKNLPSGISRSIQSAYLRISVFLIRRVLAISFSICRSIVWVPSVSQQAFWHRYAIKKGACTSTFTCGYLFSGTQSDCHPGASAPGRISYVPMQYSNTFHAECQYPVCGKCVMPPHEREEFSPVRMPPRGTNPSKI